MTLKAAGQSYFFNILLVGSYHFDNFFKNSFISIHVKVYFLEGVAIYIPIYIPLNSWSILFLQFFYSRVIQFWSHFSEFFYLNSLLVKVYFFEDTAINIYISLGLWFSYSRVIQFWSHFSECFWSTFGKNTFMYLPGIIE